MKGRTRVSPARRAGSAATRRWGGRRGWRLPPWADPGRCEGARPRLACTPGGLSGYRPVGWEARVEGAWGRAVVRPARGLGLSGRPRVDGCWKPGVNLTTITASDRLEKTTASRTDMTGDRAAGGRTGCPVARGGVIGRRGAAAQSAIRATVQGVARAATQNRP